MASSQLTAIVPLRVRGREHLLRVTKEGALFTASVDVATPWGPVHVRASADQEVLRRMLHDAARSRLATFLPQVVSMIGDDEDFASGDAWGDFKDFFEKTIPKEAKKMAKSKVFRDVAKGINAVTDHPAYNVAMAAVNVIPGYGQAISAAMGATKMAAAGMSLLARGKQGDPAAQGAIKQIAASAKAGDPRAQKAMGTLKAIDQMPQLNASAMDQAARMAPQMQAQAAASMPFDQMLIQTAEGFGNAISPGFANNEAYQAMKAAYTMGRGIVDMAIGDDGAFYPVNVGGARIVRRYDYRLPPPRFLPARRI